MNMEEKILQIPIDKIIPNRFQPRLTFDETALQELAASIKEHGIIQPLVLRNLGDKYEIIAGERRFKASQMAGLTTVPAVISNIDDDKSAEVALVENIQRKNLTSIEEAKSYKNILDKGYLTQEQLAEKLGVSQSTVANKLRLLNLADEVQDALLKEKISERHARALLAVKDPQDQVKWLNRILNDRLTVRQLDIELKKELRDSADEEDEGIPIVNLTPNINDIRENAVDINPQQGLHDIESMLKPSVDMQNNYDLSNPVDNVETLDFDDNVENEAPVNTNDNNVVENKPVEDNKIPNKFFNFLEDESANMNAESSLDDIFGVNNTIANVDTEVLDDSPNTEILENNSFEKVDNNNILSVDNNIQDNINTLDDNLVINNSVIDNQIQQPVDNSIITPQEPIIQEPIENQPTTNKFFNFGLENNNEASIDVNNTNSINNDVNNTIIDQDNSNNIVDNNIIEIQEDKKEEIFDPMNMVNTLEDNYQEKVEEEEGIDLKTAINSIRGIKDTLEQKGFNITIDEADLGDSYNITINIIK